jgi:hypothetical protein
MHHANVNVPLFILIFGLQSDEEIFEAIRGGSPDGHYVEEELGCVRMLSSRDLRSSFRDVI